MEHVITESNSPLKEVGENAFYMNDIKKENFIAPKEKYNTFKTKIFTNRQADDDVMFAEMLKISNDGLYPSKEEYAFYNQIFLKYAFYESYRRVKEIMSRMP